MTLELADVARQLPMVLAAYRERLAGFDRGLAAAQAALGRWSADPGGADAAIAAAMAESSRPYALTLGEDPALRRAAPPFTPMTVVAADGSSIEPDRFAPAPCFVVSTGAVALPYGVPGAPLLERTALVGPRELHDEGEDDGGELAGGGWGINLQRDARELARGAELAAERTAHGPVALLLDGTLFPWDLDARQVSEAVRRDARRRTQDALDLLYTCHASIALGAYVSGSRAADVVTSLRVLGDDPGWPPTDGHFFRGLLADGERSALFRAQSERTGRVEELFSPKHEVCFFYLRSGADVARVELPYWATHPDQVDRLHAALIDQCARCDGYPRALQEAHEQAVISGGDRLQFSRMLEAEASRQGLRGTSGGKQASKRRRAV